MSDPGGLTYEFPDLSPGKRLRELILYVADKAQHDERCGITKLAKIIYHADFLAWRLQGQPVTGTRWKRMEHGPAPADFHKILDELSAAGRISIVERTFHDYRQKRIVAHDSPASGLFSDHNLRLVDQVIQKLLGWNASELSERTHGTAAWQLTEGAQFIPYEYALYSDEPLTKEELKHAQELALEYRAFNFE